MFFGRLGSLFHRGEMLGSDRGLSILSANFCHSSPKDGLPYIIKGLLGMMIMFVGGMMQEVPVRYDPFNVEVVYVHIWKVMELCT